jgi:hypothetical protein
MPDSSSRQATQFLRREASAIPFVSWALRDSNPRPSPCKGDALPAELSARSHTIGMPAGSAHHVSQGDGQAGGPASLAPVEALLPVGAVVLAVRTDQDLNSPGHRACPRHSALVGIEGGAVAEEAVRPVRRPHGAEDIRSVRPAAGTRRREGSGWSQPHGRPRPCSPRRRPGCPASSSCAR